MDSLRANFSTFDMVYYTIIYIYPSRQSPDFRWAKMRSGVFWRLTVDCQPLFPPILDEALVGRRFLCRNNQVKSSVERSSFLAHLSQRLEWAIVIAHRPSSVRPSVRPSVRRPSSVRRKLSHFRLLLWNRWKEFNETWQEARSQRPLPSLCFSGGSEKTRWPPWPLIGWDIFDFSSKTAERNSTKLDRKQDLNDLYQVCVFRADCRPGLWLAETFSTSPLKPLNGIHRNLTGRKIPTPSTKFVFFGPIGKTRWPPWPLIGWDIFYFSSETAEWNSTKLDRKLDLKALYQYIFLADWENKMAALAPDWPRHFGLLLWNRWTEFKETW